MKNLAPFAAIFWVVLTCFGQLNAQFVLPQGVDRLGNNHHPTAGILPDKVEKSIPAKLAEQFSTSIFNTLKGKAQTPYGLVSKKELDEAMRALDLTNRETIRRSNLFWSTVPVQKMVRLDFYHYDLRHSVDTTKDFATKKPIITNSDWMTAFFSLTLVDVASSKIIAAKHFEIFAHSTDTPLNVTTAPNDSIRAFRQLCKLSNQAVAPFLIDAIMATGNVEQILEEKKGKAKTVKLNNCGFAASGPFEDGNVYGIKKKFPINDLDTIYQLELVSRIRKNNDFDWKLMNFDVHGGEKDMLENFNAGVPLIVVRDRATMPPILVSPEFGRPTLQLDSFSNKSKLPSKWMPSLRQRCLTVLAKSPSLMDLVDRDSYDYILSERKLQQKVKSDATQQGITIGSEKILAAEINDFIYFQEIILDWTPAEKEAMAKSNAEIAAFEKAEEKKKKEAKDKGVKYEEPKNKPKKMKEPLKTVPIQIIFTTSLIGTIKLVSLTTGEVLFSTKIGGGGKESIPFTFSRSLRDIALEQAMVRSMDDFAKDIHRFLAPKLAAPLRILEITKKDDDEVEEILAQGGLNYGFFDGQRFEIVEVSEEMVDGQKLSRVEVVGKARVNENYLETMQLKIIDGEKDIFKKMNAKSKLAVRLIDYQKQ